MLKYTVLNVHCSFSDIVRRIKPFSQNLTFSLVWAVDWLFKKYLHSKRSPVIGLSRHNWQSWGSLLYYFILKMPHLSGQLDYQVPHPFPIHTNLGTKWGLPLFILLESAQECSLFITSTKIELSSLSSNLGHTDQSHSKQALSFFLGMFVITLEADTLK